MACRTITANLLLANLHLREEHNYIGSMVKEGTISCRSISRSILLAERSKDQPSLEQNIGNSSGQCNVLSAKVIKTRLNDDMALGIREARNIPTTHKQTDLTKENKSF